MLIDDFMPDFDFVETHKTRIHARPGEIFRALNEADLCESVIVRWLFRLRGLPTEKMTLRDLLKIRFETLGESENREILLGLAGRFWKIQGDLQKVDSRNFREFNRKGFAKAVWNFSVDETNGETQLTTETRVKCIDAESRKSFGLYWILIRPFSGLIRKKILKTIKRNAEYGKSDR